MASNIEKDTIYVALLNEGTPVWRPTEGLKICADIYELQATPDYDSEDEEWEFKPGTKVICELEVKNGEELRIAKRMAEK